MEELEICDKVFIIPDSTSWNPCNEGYSINEDYMTEFDRKTSNFKPKSNELHDKSQDMHEVLPSIESINSIIDAIICLSIIQPSTITMETIGVPGKESISFENPLKIEH